MCIDMALSKREKFVYLSTSVATSPMLAKLSQHDRTNVLRRMCPKLGIATIQNKEVIDIFTECSNLRYQFGTALLEVISNEEFRKVRETVLDDPIFVEKAITQIENNPELLEKISKMLKDKNLI